MSYEMNPILQKDIVTALTGSVYQGVVKGKYITRIACPSCHEREAFTSATAPWVIKCGRSNACGASHHVKDELPELFETWTERYQPSSEAERAANPTAVADGYLRDGRGFDLLKIRGWYTQEWYQNHELNVGSTTVRFAMPNGFWERVLDKPQRFGKQKARCVGEYAGLVWRAPTLDWATLADAREIWIVEGIFDAIALLHHGIAAVSNISSSNYPGTFLDQLAKVCGAKKRPTLVWAQDADKAGRVATEKFARMAENDGWLVRAAQPPHGKDWNDLHQLQDDKFSDKQVKKYLYHGDLLLAKSPTEKALLMYHETERREFWFTYRGRVYWWKLDIEAFNRELRNHEMDGVEMVPPETRDKALKTAGLVVVICKVIAKPLYFLQNKLTDESWYYMQIETPEGALYKHAFTAKQLTSVTEFKNRLLAVVPDAWFTGNAKQLDMLMQDKMHGIKTVETIDYIGYSREHKAYIYHDVAVKEGRMMRVNAEDFFEFGKLSIKSLAQSPELHLNTKLEQYNPAWAMHVHKAFGDIGTVASAWWLGSLFAEQIRAEHKGFPFYELVGEAGSGKTTLLEFLWKLLGRDHEGADPNKATVAARARMFSQVANMPVMLIESDREQDKAHAKQFDWDELKTLFNGRATRSRGVKNNGNDTYEPPFRAAIGISQNAKVDGSDAIMSRIVHNTLTREHQTPESKQHSDWLNRCDMASVSGFLITAIQAESTLMALFNERIPRYEEQLMSSGKVRMTRIALTHAMLMALVDCLGKDGLKLLPDYAITSAHKYIYAMAQERQAAISADHPAVVEFWEAYDYLESMLQGQHVHLNHYDFSSNQIAINLKEVERWAGEYRLRIGDIASLKKLLRGSKSRRFIEASKTINSRATSKSVRCWIFEK